MRIPLSKIWKWESHDWTTQSNLIKTTQAPCLSIIHSTLDSMTHGAALHTGNWVVLAFSISYRNLSYIFFRLSHLQAGWIWLRCRKKDRWRRSSVVFLTATNANWIPNQIFILLHSSKINAYKCSKTNAPKDLSPNCFFRLLILNSLNSDKLCSFI